MFKLFNDILAKIQDKKVVKENNDPFGIEDRTRDFVKELNEGCSDDRYKLYWH